MVLLAALSLAAATILISQQATAAPKLFLITTQDDPKEANEDIKNYQQENGHNYADSDNKGSDSADSVNEGSDSADSDNEGSDYADSDKEGSDYIAW